MQKARHSLHIYDSSLRPNGGVGANKATVAQAAEHVPKAALQAMMAAGAAAQAITVPNVKPAAA
ncbi:hypothetical protein APHAL10511_005560 [Amanita phalloides]|nr:hypothetical protein APHAL10511_005560 [Amanita phalloides]